MYLYIEVIVILFEEVDPQDFERLYYSLSDQAQATLYGCQFDTHYEVIDYVIEYATLMFDERSIAIKYINNNYSNIQISYQPDIFEMLDF